MELAASEATGTLSLEANGAITDSGTLAISGATSITATGQDVSLTNPDSSFGDFTVDAKDVYIVETGSFTANNITAETVEIKSTEGVSVISSGDGLKFAAQSTNGDINILNTGGLVISELDNIKGVQFTDKDASGKISLVAKSPLIINAPVDAKGGDVLLVASGTESVDDITVKSSIIGNMVDLYAGDSISIEGSGKIDSPEVDLIVGANYDITTGEISSGSSTAGLSLNSTVGLKKVNIPSIGIIAGTGRVSEFSQTGIVFIDDYLNALNPILEESVNLVDLGVTGSVSSEIYNYVDGENRGSVEIKEKK